ncbi:MAG: hypothetical protein PHV05_05430 [Candidatus Riflebacteria bacterium]|nr:hypothetical protein [Candidatus Riflebacteria bacterium]
MAISASISAQRFQASSFSRKIVDFLRQKTAEPAETTSVSPKDQVELSPLNKTTQTITQFRQQTSVRSELNLKLTVNSDQSLEQGNIDPKIQRDFDLMLRMISKNDEEYTVLKNRFDKMFRQTREAFSSSHPHVDGENADNSASTAPDQPDNATESMVDIDGRLTQRNVYEIKLKFQINSDNEERIGISLEEMGIKQVDPLVLDLSGKGIKLTKAGKGALFDITADGKLDSTAWVKGDTALLTYDRDGNGVIDDGRELFGDQNSAANGFAELAKHDNNSDGKINNLDPVFKALKLYRDLNSDGRIDENELSTLPELGIKSLNLNFTRASADINGNSLILNGSFEREDGSTGQLADVLLGYRKV